MDIKCLAISQSPRHKICVSLYFSMYHPGRYTYEILIKHCYHTSILRKKKDSKMISWRHMLKIGALKILSTFAVLVTFINAFLRLRLLGIYL